jgi:organic hydroperoxide reductase OsmC/OhrA
METTPAQAPPRMKRRSYDYRTSVRWTGERNGLLESDGKPDITVSSPPEFRGQAGQWTPEDLLVASVEICTMTTFIAFSMRNKLPLVSYESAATGTMEFTDDAYRFTRITLRPRIVVETDEAVALAAAILRDAHHDCFIANSICGQVMLEPTITKGSPCSSGNSSNSSESGPDAG